MFRSKLAFLKHHNLFGGCATDQTVIAKEWRDTGHGFEQLWLTWKCPECGWTTVNRTGTTRQTGVPHSWPVSDDTEYS